MKLKFGDIISFYFHKDSCWGPEGDHTAIILYGCDLETETKKLRPYYLDKDMINIRITGGLCDPLSSDIEEFIRQYGDSVTIIGNIAMRGVEE